MRDATKIMLLAAVANVGMWYVGLIDTDKMFPSKPTVAAPEFVLPAMTLPKDFGVTGRPELFPPLTTLTVWLCQPGAPHCTQNGSALAQSFLLDLKGCEKQFVERWGDVAPPGAVVRHRCEIIGFAI